MCLNRKETLALTVEFVNLVVFCVLNKFERFPEHLYSQALSFYSDALKLKNDPIILCNRALVHLKCENFGSALADSSAAIVLNPQNAKVLYQYFYSLVI